jgi:ketosteroid isomerase-like protein
MTLSDRMRAGIDAFREQGVDGLLPFLSEDVVWEEDPNWPDTQTWHGREGVRASFEERLDSTAIVPEAEEVHELPGRVLTLMLWTAEGEGSGAVATLRTASIAYFEGELIVRLRLFLDRDQAWEVFQAG